MDPESLYLESEIWQRITETLRIAPDLPAFACLPRLIQRIAQETWTGNEGEMVQIEAPSEHWSAAIAALDILDKPAEGRSLGFWLMKARECAKRSREMAGKK